MDAFGAAYSANDSHEIWYRLEKYHTWFTEVTKGSHVCDMCGNKCCHNEFAVKYLHQDLEEKGFLKKNGCYDTSEKEIIGNTLRRQVFYEDYWKMARELYDTSNWTSLDFMFIPKCVHYYARQLFPAPMDCLSICFVDKEAEARANYGLFKLVGSDATP